MMCEIQKVGGGPYCGIQIYIKKCDFSLEWGMGHIESVSLLADEYFKLNIQHIQHKSTTTMATPKTHTVTTQHITTQLQQITKNVSTLNRSGICG